MANKISLANKYRPKTFSDVSEQDSIRVILENQINNDQIKHAYLFCGGAGTGKTTLARIVADEMNNHQGKPIELDCASHNGVEDMRLIQEECRTRPLEGKYKIFILDECFYKDTKITTFEGSKNICDIKKGDVVASINGWHTVTNVFKTLVNKDRLITIHTNRGEIKTTKDHLFFTQNGWIEACNLTNESILFDIYREPTLWSSINKFKIKNETELKTIRNGDEYICISKSKLHKDSENNSVQNIELDETLIKEYKDNFINISSDLTVVNYIEETQTDKESEFMYDLEVKDGYSYFANNVLVHNCHMITAQGWNSMLKILEEPPEFIIFIFATTDPQKIIGTIMSRVQRFNFSRISTLGIINRLKYIITSENKDKTVDDENYIKYEDEAVEYLARLSKGGMRDAITTLEKCLDYNRYLSLDNVLKITSGGVTEYTLLNLLKTILKKDAKSAIEQFNDIYLSGVDTTLFLKLYIEFLENCVKYIITSNGSIVTISSLAIQWLEDNKNSLSDIREQLIQGLNIRLEYSSIDTKILVESWIIKLCS